MTQPQDPPESADPGHAPAEPATTIAPIVSPVPPAAAQPMVTPRPRTADDPGPTIGYPSSAPYAEAPPFPPAPAYPTGPAFPETPSYPATTTYPAASDPYSGSYETPTGYTAPGAALPAPYTPPTPSYGFVQPPQYAYVDPNAPVGFDPVTGRPLSDKSKVIAGLLQLLLGFMFTLGGVGRLYAGQTALGVAQIVVSVLAWIAFWCGFALFFVPWLVWVGAWLWFVIDGIVLLAKGGLDGQGRALRG